MHRRQFGFLIIVTFVGSLKAYLWEPLVVLGGVVL